MTSVRQSAAIWITAVLVVVGLIAFMVAYEIARREAADFLEGQLRQIALNVGEGSRAAGMPAGLRDPEDEFVIETWGPAGDRPDQSETRTNIPRLLHPGFATIHAAGDDWRVYRIDSPRRSVQVAQRMSVQTEMAEAAALEAGLPVLIAIPLAWLAIGWALARVFGRLLLVERQIAARGVESIDPIPVGDVPAEVLPLVQAMNDLIGRIRMAVEHQRRFVADAAHELRTPLAALQIQIDNLAAAEFSSRDRSLGEIRAGIRRTARLADQLLRMARLEEDQPSTQESVDLTAVVTQCVADFVPIAVAKGVDLGMVASDRVTVTGTVNDLKMLFGNLIENAIRYTPGGGTIDVSIHRAGLFTAIEIADTGCGIAEENMPRVFNRFFRAASDDSDGSGLGLSIVAAVAKHHGFRVVLQNRDDRRGLRAQILIDHPENAPLIPG